MNEESEETLDEKPIKEIQLTGDERLEKGLKPEVPDCDCFNSTDKAPAEPGSYYTHLGKYYCIFLSKCI